MIVQAGIGMQTQEHQEVQAITGLPQPAGTMFKKGPILSTARVEIGRRRQWCRFRYVGCHYR